MIDVIVAYFLNLDHGECASLFVVVEGTMPMPSISHFVLALRTILDCTRLIHSHLEQTVVCSTDEVTARVYGILRRFYKFQRPVRFFASLQESERALSVPAPP